MFTISADIAGTNYTTNPFTQRHSNVSVSWQTGHQFGDTIQKPPTVVEKKHAKMD